jgi:hypothetical protein
MGDRLRIVQERWPRRPVVVYDLSTATVFPQRGSFKITPGKAAPIMVDQGGRYGGSTVADERLSNGSVSVSLIVLGSSADNTLDIASEVVRQVSEPPRGRWLEWRPDGAGQSIYFELRGSAGWDAGYDWAPFAGAGALTLPLTWNVAPVALGDHADAVDLFESDTLTSGDWAVDAGGGTLSVVAGELVPSSVALKRLRYVANGYTWRNGWSMIRWRAGSSVASYDVAVGLATRSSADDGIYARLNAGNLTIATRIGGTYTALATTAFTPSTNTDYWLVVRREGARVAAQIYTPFRPLVASDTQTSAAAAAVLTAANVARFPPGYFGVAWTPGVTSERVSDFQAMPYTFDRSGDDMQDFDAEAAPGDVPALADVSFAMDADTAYGILGWWRQPRVANALAFGGDSSGFWATALLANINAAGTSVADVTPTVPKFARSIIRFVTTATSGSGAHSSMTLDSIRRRRVYVALGWVLGSSGSAKVLAGSTGGAATIASPAVTLSATAWQLAAVCGTFAADAGDVYFAVTNGSAAITTIDADGLAFYSPAAITDMTTTATSGATSLPAREIPAEWPAAPFYAVLVNTAGASEVIRVLPGSTAGALLCDRGQLGTTALSVTANMIVAPMPEGSRHLGGGGAAASRGYGYLEGVQAVVETASGGAAWTNGLNAGYHAGNFSQLTVAAGAGGGQRQWLYDPSVIADDQPGGLTTLEVYMTALVESSLPQTLRATLYYLATGAGTLSYTQEFGTIGVPVDVTPTANVRKTTFLGTLAFANELIDGAPPATLVLDLSYGSGGAGSIYVDYLLLVPGRSRVASPEGKPVDSSYPYFYKTGLALSAGAGVKTIRSDRSGVIAENAQGWRPYSDGQPTVGLGGATIEPPWQKRGGCFVYRASATHAPGETGATTNETDVLGHFHVAVQPRYALWRGALE